ncbi:MAG: hypothetical protein ABR608_07555 [Pseudonocardiaceae bacterium]
MEYPFGMGDECHAGGQQFRAGGLDLDRRTPVDADEGKAVIRALDRTVLELGLRHGRPASPRRRLRRNPRWATRRERSLIVRSVGR